MDRETIDDMELDQLLAKATTPALTPGFEERLLKRMGEETAPVGASNVIAFPASRAKTKLIQWLAVVPLAAALAGGFYLGMATDVPDLLTQGNAVASAADEDFTIFDNLDFVSQDGQS